MAVELDVTNEGHAQEAVRAALALFGRIDVLVNNAGRGLPGYQVATAALAFSPAAGVVNELGTATDD